MKDSLVAVCKSICLVCQCLSETTESEYVERLKGQWITDVLRATLEVLTFRKNYVQRLKLTRLENVL